MPIYDRKMETLSRGALEQLQLERLQITLNRVVRNVAFYRQQFDSRRIDTLSIKSLDDLRRLPFTTKDDVRRGSPYDMFAVPLRDIVRVQCSAGTTGDPVGVGYTANDIRHWSGVIARILAAAGVSDQDFIQISFPYGLMTGGMGFHYGAERIGASVIPASGEEVHRQITIMKYFKATVLVGRPGYALAMARAMAEMNLRPEQLNLRCGVFGSEPWSENQRAQIQEQLRIRAYDSYGLSEIMGPGLAGECEEQNGMHIQEDHFIAEVINPDTLEPAPAGEEGELVFTTITKEAFPMIRYRTGDIARITDEPCACGRTFRRMSRVKDRTDNLIFVSGHKFFPSEVDEIIQKAAGLSPNFKIVLDRKEGAEAVEIHLEVTSDFPQLDEIKALERMRESVARALVAALGVEVDVKFVQPASRLTAGGKKVIPIEDRRKQDGQRK